MDARFVSTGEVPQVAPSEGHYWVRFWTPPHDENGPWSVDEWAVVGASDVESVIRWAHENAPGGASSEIFVEAVDHRLSPGGELVEVKQRVRVFGRPRDAAAASETVTLYES